VTYDAPEWRDRVRALNAQVLRALGFDAKPGTLTVVRADQSYEVTVAHAEKDLVALDCGWSAEPDDALDPDGAGRLLDEVRLDGQHTLTTGSKLASFLFACEDAPRYVLLLVGGVVVLADRGSAPTLVFDEVDTGVGGAVSDAIGHRLARLAERVQVMAVTHAPQVAARASSHFLIAKEPVPETERVATRVSALAPTPRREEIARMLAGASVTDEARAAAQKLIEAASAAASTSGEMPKRRVGRASLSG